MYGYIIEDFVTRKILTDSGIVFEKLKDCKSDYEKIASKIHEDHFVTFRNECFVPNSIHLSRKRKREERE